MLLLVFEGGQEKARWEYGGLGTCGLCSTLVYVPWWRVPRDLRLSQRGKQNCSECSNNNWNQRKGKVA